MAESVLIGRKKEKEILKGCYEAETSQLVLIYGRRRVGKTFLVNQLFENKITFRFTGEYNAPTNIQLYNFADELGRLTAIDKITSWKKAFGVLRTYLESLDSNEKQLVFFDEMPWIDTPRSGFLSSFEYFWNSWGASRNNLMIIVSGSSASWMSAKIERNKGGLFNRQNSILYLEPFSLNECEEYLESRGIYWSRYDIASCYMIMGGIPFYLSLLRKEMSFSRNIDNLFFQKNAILKNEFSNLYRTLFFDDTKYIKMVQTLALKRSGFTRAELIKRFGFTDNANLTTMLNNLISSGFVRSLNTFGKRKRDLKYMLSDYYTAFYLKFCTEEKDENFWSNQLDSSSIKAWLGLSFERLCLDCIGQIRKKLGISGVLTDITTWEKIGTDEEKGCQIDLILNRDDRIINIIEIKYCEDEYKITNEYNENLRRKITIFRDYAKTKKAIQLIFVSTYGVAKNKYSSIVTNELTLEDLFSN